jgi:hypothetical protein
VHVHAIDVTYNEAEADGDLVEAHVSLNVVRDLQQQRNACT